MYIIMCCLLIRLGFKQKIHYRMHMETVQTQIRLLLKEQSDLGLHCLPMNFNFVDFIDV